MAHINIRDLITNIGSASGAPSAGAAPAPEQISAPAADLKMEERRKKEVGRLFTQLLLNSLIWPWWVRVGSFSTIVERICYRSSQTNFCRPQTRCFDVISLEYMLFISFSDSVGTCEFVTIVTIMQAYTISGVFATLSVVTAVPL